MNIEKQLEALLDYEIRAKNLYKDYVKKIPDKTLFKIINKIEKDEIKHIKLVKELIRINQRKKRKCQKQKKKN